jgi:hypothetical protein
MMNSSTVNSSYTEPLLTIAQDTDYFYQQLSVPREPQQGLVADPRARI